MITVITTYDQTHTDAIAEIFYRASLLAHPFLSEDFLQQEMINVREIYLPNVETWVLIDQDQTVGFISLLDQEVMALFVAPDFHGGGFGKALMDKAVAEKGDLEVVVFKNNPIGRAFYDRYGFTFLSKFLHEPTGQICLRLSYKTAGASRTAG